MYRAIPSRHAFRRVLGVAVVLATWFAAAPALAQLRVMSWNVARLNGDANAMAGVFASAADDDRPGFAVAPHVVVLQEVRAADVGAIEAMLNAIDPAVVYVRATYTTSPSEDQAGGAQALFYREDTLVEMPSAHRDLATGGGRNTDRWLLRLAGYSSPDARLYVYSSHLKAGNTSADAGQRLAGAQTVRADADALPAGTHVLYAGDWNVYSHNEGAYVHFLSAGPGQAFDPLGSGTWSGSGHAIKHTQSPRSITAGGLIGGGMNDRFDFVVSTAAVQDGDGLSIIPGTVRAFGNDGQHFNLAINAGNNFYFPGQLARSNALADLLHDASDHIPVLADLTIPPIMGVSLPLQFGRVMQGTPFTVPLEVQNAAPVSVPQGADPLRFSLATSGAFLGSFAGTAPLVPAGARVNVPVSTAIPGPATGTATVTCLNQGAQNATLVRSASGTVLRRSNPSFLAKADVDARTVALEATAGAPGFVVEVPIANFGFSAFQSRLDVDLVLGLGAGVTLAAPLPRDLAAEPGILAVRIGSESMAAGTLVRELLVVTSDEDVPGEDSDVLTLRLEIEIRPAGSPADLNGDGRVDAVDLASLLAAWGGSGPADLDGNGIVSAEDLAILLAAWG